MKTDTQIIVSSTVCILLFGIITSVLLKTYSAPETQDFEGSWACTADVYVCPDGTEVLREPPYCHFAACPGA